MRSETIGENAAGDRVNKPTFSETVWAGKPVPLYWWIVLAALYATCFFLHGCANDADAVRLRDEAPHVVVTPSTFSPEPGEIVDVAGELRGFSWGEKTTGCLWAVWKRKVELPLYEITPSKPIKDAEPSCATGALEISRVVSYRFMVPGTYAVTLSFQTRGGSTVASKTIWFDVRKDSK